MFDWVFIQMRCSHRSKLWQNTDRKRADYYAGRARLASKKRIGGSAECLRNTGPSVAADGDPANRRDSGGTQFFLG